MAKTAKEILKSDDDFIETLTEIEEALIIERMELYANQFKPPMSVKYDKRATLNQQQYESLYPKVVEAAANAFAKDNNFNIPYTGAIRERVKEGFIAGASWQASHPVQSVKQGQAEEWVKHQQGDASPVPSDAETSPPLPKCMVCGGETAFIRGKYPGMAKRSVCPVCAYERLEMIQDISSVNYGIPVKEQKSKQ